MDNKIQSILDRLALNSDLSQLTEEEKRQYFYFVCRKYELDSCTSPFAFIRFKDSNKLQLYARKNCSDQLRKIQGIDAEIVHRGQIETAVYVEVKVTDKSGRKDTAMGAVPISTEDGRKLSPVELAHALMTCETKAKRRATLSLCGLAMMDETEVDTLPGVERFDMQSIKVNQNPSIQPKQSHNGRSVMVQESVKKQEQTKEEKSVKRIDSFDMMGKVIKVHKKIHAYKKYTNYNIEFVVKDESRKPAVMMKYDITATEVDTAAIKLGIMKEGTFGNIRVAKTGQVLLLQKWTPYIHCRGILVGAQKKRNITASGFLYVIQMKEENGHVVEVFVLHQFVNEFEQLFQEQKLKNVFLDVLLEKTSKGYVLIKYNIC
ncbi:hypothetical protein [Bacillus cereus]|uniref:Uncharacterized protein n=1 Tax=Bacillus cereus HuA4-10 TaxID=1053206 RepID=J8DDX3_BACCE|nr:hypothetical protein [Bacillus cereus]EJQ74330.1 hypothetical protein IGC_04881 [Bacillus cereus HuA4-10]